MKNKAGNALDLLRDPVAEVVKARKHGSTVAELRGSEEEPKNQRTRHGKPAEGRVKVNLSLPETMHDDLKAVAFIAGDTLGGIVQRAVAELMDREGWRERVDHLRRATRKG